MGKTDNVYKDYESLFTEKEGITGSALYEGGYRVKLIISGPMLEVQVYPAIGSHRVGAQVRKMSEKEKEHHREVVRRHHRKERMRQLERLINANFVKGDLVLTITYRQGEEPANDDQARNDICNYLRRVKRLRQRKGLGELKYAYVIEVTHSTLGTRYHYHIIMSGGITLDEA